MYGTPAAGVGGGGCDGRMGRGSGGKLAGGVVGGFARGGPLGLRSLGSTCAGIPLTVELGDGGGTVGGFPGGRPPSDELMPAS